MILWNAKNPELASIALIPWFVPDGTHPIEMACELVGRLEKKPDETFCLIAHENNIIQAMLVAYRSKRKTVFLWQACQRPGFRFTKLVFEYFKQWAKALGCKEIRMKTPNRKRAFQKRWGFEPHRDYMRIRL